MSIQAEDEVVLQASPAQRAGDVGLHHPKPHPERKGAVMGMDDETDPGQDVSGRWIGGLIALGIVILVVYMAVTGNFPK
jgi:hypothetical protein